MPRSYLGNNYYPEREPVETPPNRAYSTTHAEKIRFHFARGMSRRSLETIYGHVAVHQVLGPVETDVMG